jgi:hypothetical protein
MHEELFRGTAENTPALSRIQAGFADATQPTVRPGYIETELTR